MALDAPLSFRPVYKAVLWGGRRLERWRPDLPAGCIGESWDLADHQGGMSVVASGPEAGLTLRALVEREGSDLVGRRFRGGSFPLMVKLIDAADRLSVQVHPDDALALSLGVGANGKTECWFVLADGGQLYQGVRAGVDRPAFEQALAAGRVEGTLAPFALQAGDCFFLPARTVHALGAGCLVYELQQTLDITFRVHDWNRVGPDGKPRPLHVSEALATIDFSRHGEGPRRPPWDHQGPARRRTLVDCAYFRLEEVQLDGGDLAVELAETCAVITCLDGAAEVRTGAGRAGLLASATVLVPAAAKRFALQATSPAQILIATPHLPA